MIYWIVFVCSLFQLASTINDSYLERLVQLNDEEDVSITVLFLVMAMGNEEADRELMQMIKCYSRKIMARGGQTRTRTKLYLRAREDSARELTWEHLRPGDHLRKYGNRARTSQLLSGKRPVG